MRTIDARVPSTRGDLSLRFRTRLLPSPGRFAVTQRCAYWRVAMCDSIDGLCLVFFLTDYPEAPIRRTYGRQSYSIVLQY